MAGDGPTTAGSIVGKLRLDTSDWDAKIAAADAAARKLGSVDPTIRVGADTSSAAEKMAGVQAAASKLGASSPNVRVTADTSTVAAKLAAVEAAERKAAISGEALRLVYRRLDDIQSKDEGTTLRLAAAQLAASRAEDSDKTATDRLASAKLALAAAEDAAGTAASDGAAKETKAAADSGGSVQRWQLIAGLIVGLIPLMAPLTGAIVALGGALAGLGGAAVLGVIGVVQAMKQGTDVGLQYSAGLKVLKGDLDSLGSTAASTLLRSFNDSIVVINGAMPFLNAQIGLFAGKLGVIGGTLLQGVVNSLHILNPLFQQATDYVQSLASGFEAWTANGGLQKFAQFAQATFPQVTQTLGALVTAAVGLATALAPIGTVMLGIVDVIANLITGLASLGPTFAIVAGGAAAAFGAFKLWGVIGPIIASVAAAIYTATDSVAALGIAIDAASGPVGWVVAGIGALVAVLGISAAATSTASSATSDYTAALQQSNGALDENVRKQAASNLSNAGLLTTAKEYHLQLSTVTDAVMGNSAAMDTVTAAAKKYGTTMVEVHGQNGAVVDSYTTLSDKARNFIAGVNGQTSSLKGQVQSARDQKAAMDDSGVSVDNLTQAEDAAKTATDKFAQALAGLGDVNLSADQANIKFQQSLADSSATIAKNGKTLDESTQAGRDNSSALDDIANSAISLISAEAKQGTSETTLQANMAASRASFIKAAEAAGDTATQANNLADKYGLIPKNVTTAYKTSGAQDAVDKANAVAAAVAAIQTSITVRVNAIMTNSTNAKIGFGLGDGHAAGGKIGKGLTGGGFSGAVAGMGNAFNDLAGMYPLSDGEFVTSNQFGQANKFLNTLQTINAGGSAGQVAASALGSSGMRFGAAPAVHNHYVTQNYYVTANDPNELTQKVSMLQVRQGAV